MTGRSTQPRAAPFHQLEKPDKIPRRPFAKRLAGAAIFLCQFADEDRVFLYRPDFGTIADDGRVGDQPIKPFIIHHGAGRDIEPAKGGLEAGPFRLNNLPRETGLKDRARHTGKPAVVAFI